LIFEIFPILNIRDFECQNTPKAALKSKKNKDALVNGDDNTEIKVLAALF
jgi:hypothetical protein